MRLGVVTVGPRYPCVTSEGTISFSPKFLWKQAIMCSTLLKTYEVEGGRDVICIPILLLGKVVKWYFTTLKVPVKAGGSDLLWKSYENRFGCHQHSYSMQLGVVTVFVSSRRELSFLEVCVTSSKMISFLQNLSERRYRYGQYHKYLVELGEVVFTAFGSRQECFLHS